MLLRITCDSFDVYVYIIMSFLAHNRNIIQILAKMLQLHNKYIIHFYKDVPRVVVT